MSVGAPDDAEVTRLALTAKAGDRDAAAAFVRATRHHVYRFLLHLVDRHDVDDVTQDTYLRAMQALRHFDGRSSAKTWLFAIARRAAADQVRTATRWRRAAQDSRWQAAHGLTQAPPVSFDDGVVLRELLRNLDQARLEAFVATQGLGLSYAEAALVCGCPVGTIRSRVSRARDDLIAALQAERRSASH
jgi:RNA polymerase sigma-70 factor, ECF subfamily